MRSISEDVQAILDAWKPFINLIRDWHSLTDGVKSKVGGWGYIYELHSPLNRLAESFAISDMNASEMPISEPHYHPRGETEIYFVLEGSERWCWVVRKVKLLQARPW